MTRPAARATRAPRRWTSSRRIRSTPRSACGAGRRAGGRSRSRTRSRLRSDANAAALSIALLGAGTACQGIFIGNDAGNPTTGQLLNIRNGGPDTDAARADRGRQDAAAGPGTARRSRDRNGREPLPLGGGRAGDGRRDRGRETQVVLTSVDKAVANGIYTVAQVAPATTIALGAGGGLRGLGVAATISVSGTLAPTSLSMFNLLERRDAVREDRSEVGRGVQEQPADQRVARRRRRRLRARRSRASSTSSACRPIDNGTASFARVYGFYMPPDSTRSAPGGPSRTTRRSGSRPRAGRGRSRS